MKKKILLLSALALTLMFTTQTALASGDKVRGDKATGDVYQNCESTDGECPFIG